MRTKISISVISLFFIFSFVHAQTNKQLPQLFLNGIVNDEFGNRDMAISLKGDEMYFTLQFNNGFSLSVILCCKKTNGKWSNPEVAPFSGQFSDLEPAFSPDGNALYFSSNRPQKGNEIKDYDIWVVKKEKNKWGTPQNIGSPVNTSQNEFYPSVATSGNIYFTREMNGRQEDIVVCKKNSTGGYDTAVSLPNTINSAGEEFNAFVDPDEKYIIFTAYKREGNFGFGDLYISYKNNKDEWQNAKNLGPVINGKGLNYCPYVSPDKKYFFFTSNKGIFKTPFDKPKSIREIKNLLHSSLNGNDNIYCVEAEQFIHSK